MKIKNLRVNNFKSIQDENVDLEGLTIFVGSNGSGKSNFLKALACFYDPKMSVDRNDFFNRDISSPIEISVTFDALSQDEIKHFGKYVAKDNTLSVIKRIKNIGTGTYYGISKGCNEFAKLTRKPAPTFKEQYQQLRQQEKYQDLPDVSTGPTIEDALNQWMEANPDKLELVESENQFFGFENSSVSSLEKFTKFVYIPAVLYESQMEDVKNTPIGELTDILARHKLKEDLEIKALQDEISKKYAEKLKPFNANEMLSLSNGVTKTLESYYSGVKIKIQLDDTNTEIKLPPPKAETTLSEGGYEAKVSSVGQGLQRAFVLSLLQYFAENQSGASNQDAFNLILGIDEPELYQHPSKQKLFYKVLQDLCLEGSAVAESIQCCYTTHSPLMISIENFNQIVRVHKGKKEEDSPFSTEIKRSSLQELSSREAKLPSHGAAFSDLKTLSSMVNAIDSRINEGFFAQTLILVEGESDVIALKLAAKYHSKGVVDLDKLDIPIIPCNGKNNIEKPAIIFESLNIATYSIWDSDYDCQDDYDKTKAELEVAPEVEKEKLKQRLQARKSAVDASVKKNRDLLSLYGVTAEDWPAHVSNKSASFRYNLEEILKDELGKDYMEELILKHNQKIQAKGPSKNPLVMTAVLSEAFSLGKRSETLDDIISNIVNLSQNHNKN